VSSHIVAGTDPELNATQLSPTHRAAVSSQTSGWAIVSIVAGALFAVLLLAARVRLKSQRGTLRVEREVPALLGAVAGLALATIGILGPASYARVLVPICFIVAGVALFTLSPNHRYGFITTRQIASLSIVLGVVGLVVALVRAPG
jgi:hypothetical protein